MTDHNNEIIDFEDLFKEEKKRREESEQDPNKKQRYIRSIVIYLLMMNVFVIFLFLIFGSQDKLTEITTENEQILFVVVSNSNAIAMMPTNEYITYETLYEDYIDSIGTYQGYEIIYNINNLHADEVLLISQEPDVLDEAMIEEIFSLNVEYWSDEGIPIMVVLGSEQILPAFIDVDEFTVNGSVKDLTDFAYSLLNFLAYLALAPLVILVLKKDIISDRLKFTKLLHPWYLIIVFGYLYYMIGNFVTIQLTEIVSSLLGILPNISVNQLTIENTLNSNGILLMILSAVILGPIVEELIFRKAIFGLFKNSYVALAVSTVSFGLVHLLGESSFSSAIVNGVPYFMMGLVFGLIYIKYEKNVFAPLLVHILTNAVSIFMILIIL